MKQTRELSEVTRTSIGLRDFLFNELDLLNRGISNPQRTNAISKAAQAILDSAELELNIAKFLSSAGKEFQKIGPIELGTL